MKETLYDLWFANRHDMTKVLHKGSKVYFNGQQFSDDAFFRKGENYNVLEVEPLGFKIEGDDCCVFIHPDCLLSFEKAL